ncbi:hypothetical protein GCM10009784_31330 [Arthrobacter parietis]|uniref:Uncharacterized protein n=1 Tax=Arthrobacter parietis TaxID=271434 RepID=A0ABN3B200_9MICC
MRFGACYSCGGHADVGATAVSGTKSHLPCYLRVNSARTFQKFWFNTEQGRLHVPVIGHDAAPKHSRSPRNRSKRGRNHPGGQRFSGSNGEPALLREEYNPFKGGPAQPA